MLIIEGWSIADFGIFEDDPASVFEVVVVFDICASVVVADSEVKT